MTFLFWSIGLIGPTKSEGQTVTKLGFNSNLPGASPSKDSSWNKLKFYEEADKDSAKYRTLQRNDPNYSLPLFSHAETVPFDTSVFQRNGENGSVSTYDPYPAGLQISRDPNEEKVYRKIAQLNGELQKSKQLPALKEGDAVVANSMEQAQIVAKPDDLNKLENLMRSTPGGDNSTDPEMQQINGMLEKILDIQHPDRVTDKIKKQSAAHKNQVFPVRINNKNMQVSLLVADTGKTLHLSQNAFYSIDDKVLEVMDETAV
ncbi:MAG: hypothetical protein ABIN94_07910, partial [Ferruginibacter sp.]